MTEPIRHRFSAPWGPTVRAATITATVLLALVAAVSNLTGRLVAVGMVLGGLLYAIRGYEVRDGRIRVLRLFWHRSFELDGLRAVEPVPGVTENARRRGGIGGVLGYIGRYDHDAVGPFTSFVSDPERAVVVVLEKRTLVVSPDAPDDFVAAVLHERGGLEPEAPEPLEPGSEVEPA